MSESDILVHLQACALDVHLRGHSFTIPAMDAIDWLKLLQADPFDPYQIFPMLAGWEAAELVQDVLWDEPDTGPEEISRLALDVVSTVGGRPWWVTLRLLGAAAGAWDRIGGTLVRERIDARTLPLAGWLDALWMIMLSYVDPKDRTSWLYKIEVAPRGWETEIDFDEQERAFLAAMKQVA